MSWSQSNKDLVLSFLKTAFVEGKPEEAASHYLKEYKQHNPTVEDGVQGFLNFASAMGKQHPSMQYEVKRVFQDGDHVIIHANLRLTPTERGMAVVDIFRVQKGKIVEHWDVIQPVPEKSANDNTMF